MSADKQYQTVSKHDDVRCPKCGRSLKGPGHQYGQLSDAQWAKHCGAPCYGTAWYSYRPGDVNAIWGNHIPFTP